MNAGPHAVVAVAALYVAVPRAVVAAAALYVAALRVDVAALMLETGHFFFLTFSHFLSLDSHSFLLNIWKDARKKIQKDEIK